MTKSIAEFKLFDHVTWKSTVQILRYQAEMLGLLTLTAFLILHCCFGSSVTSEFVFQGASKFEAVHVYNFKVLCRSNYKR